ncbi:MAG: hypothetical protein JWP52_3455 [Rhizobacter sp.]|nr:hypothetical protein [Rhizobacter sp.]
MHSKHREQTRQETVAGRVISASPRIQLEPTGDRWRAVFETFEGFNESPSGFGNSPPEAIDALFERSRLFTERRSATKARCQMAGGRAKRADRPGN